MKKIIFYLFPILITIGCKKQKIAPGPSYYKLSPEGSEYVQLRENSYFIYKDSATNTTDSVVVVESQVDKVFQNGGIGVEDLPYPSFYYDYFTLKLKVPDLGSSNWLSALASSETNGNISICIYK